MLRLPNNRRTFAAFAGLGLLAAVGTALLARTPVSTAGPSTGPVVVELFTSQGCSSCPPADAFASRLAKESGVLVISRPVTYWDRLGWTDTLARQANTDLQRAYAGRRFDDNGVYTPQMVIDGRRGAVGSLESRVRTLVAGERNRARPKVLVTGSGSKAAIVVEGASDSVAEIALLSLRPSVTVGIGSGENGGRKVTYTNVVEDEHVLGTWAGGRKAFALPPKGSAPGRLRAVIVRQPDGGPILAGRTL